MSETNSLYEQYGKLMIQQEITQAQINEVKRKIAEELNKPIIPTVAAD